MADAKALEYKLVVMGMGAVGKSALTVRLVADNFLEDYDPTIEDSYRKQVLIDGQSALLEILDTAGQEEFSTMQDQWMRNGKGFLLVYSITNHQSFDECANIREKILRTQEGNPKVPIVLVGNKCDLESERAVTRLEGTNLAARWGCGFFETSARSKICNEECFFELVRRIRRQAEEEQKSGAAGGKKEKKKNKCTIL